MRQYLVRVGAMGGIGRFAATDGLHYRRGLRAVCRTARGLEVGEILAACENDAEFSDGSLLRPLAMEDELLVARMEKNKAEAFEACNRLLRERQISAVLMDVEQLLDGESLYFYFLGDVTPELEQLTSELAEAYEAKVQFRQFVETALAGCGPGCGTSEATGSGCGTGGCSTCAVAAKCGTRKGA